MKNIQTKPAAYYLITSLTLLALTFLIFSPSLKYGFSIVDDDVYVTENSFIKSGISVSNTIKAFTATHANFYHPLTTLSHMLDIELHGLNPKGHHFTSILLHALNTLLVFLLIFQMTSAFWKSMMVSILFSIHPLHVESVVWIAERKDVLSTFFLLLSMISYVRYTDKRDKRNYFISAFLFVLSLLSKPMGVTLPFVLLLLDYWPFGRIKGICPEKKAHESLPFMSLVKEKIPLIAIALIFSFMAFSAQLTGGAIAGTTNFPISVRVANAFISYVRYLYLTIWPINLTLFYPHPGTSISFSLAGLSFGFLVIVSLSVIKYYKKNPYLVVCWFWFLGTLVPVIGMIQVGSHAMADRYTYFPLIAVFIAMVWGVEGLLKSVFKKWQMIGMSLFIIVAATLTARTLDQIGIWKDDITNLSHSLLVTENNILAHQNLGVIFQTKGDLEKAAYHFKSVLEINPEYFNAYNGLGNVELAKVQPNKAIFYFKQAIAIKPDFEMAYNNLGNAFAKTGNLDEAMNQYNKALKINPFRPETHFNLGEIYSEKGVQDKAVIHLEEAVRLDPNFLEARNNLGIAYYKTGNLDNAIDQFKYLLTLNPDYPNAHYNLGIAYGEKGDNERAFEEMQKAMSGQR